MELQDRTEEEGLATLARIENDLSTIKEHSATPRRAFLLGILQGAGAVLGGILAVILLGWVLSISGVIPGLSYFAHYIQNAADRVERNP